ncbi:DMT family transporter [Candidatus Acetothermia bacterium]|nr:DMT family transporter [Candidatus Acetothermia bacterium]MBI3644053.1 DMT family transporter [Candidatus Acetothermia bacterium]
MNLPVLVWFILGSIWGSTWLFIKLGLADLPPFTFAGIRFLIAIIPLILLVWLTKREIPKIRSDWILMAGTGILTFTCNYGLVFWGENHISSGLTAILYTMLPLFGLVIAQFRLPSEPITPAKIFGVLLGITGVALIFSKQIQVDDPIAPLGAAAIILAAIGTSLAGIEIKARGRHLDPLVLTTVQIAIGFLPLLAFGLITEGDPLTFHWTPLAWISILYLAFIGSALAFVLLYWLLKRMDVTKVQLMPFLSTLIAVILGWLVLNEELSWRTLVGGAAILSGLAVATFKKRPAVYAPAGGQD